MKCLTHEVICFFLKKQIPPPLRPKQIAIANARANCPLTAYHLAHRCRLGKFKFEIEFMVKK